MILGADFFGFLFGGKQSTILVFVHYTSIESKGNFRSLAEVSPDFHT
jgi:hypothetical protein